LYAMLYIVYLYSDSILSTVQRAGFSGKIVSLLPADLARKANRRAYNTFKSIQNA
jgi:hypothetical protein